MNIIPNLPILHSKKTVGKFVFTQNYLQSPHIWKYTNQFREANYRYNKAKRKRSKKLRLETIWYILQTRNYLIHTTDFKLFEHFTVKDSIEILLNLLNNKIKDILEQVGLEHKINSKVKHL